MFETQLSNIIKFISSKPLKIKIKISSNTICAVSLSKPLIQRFRSGLSSLSSTASSIFNSYISTPPHPSLLIFLPLRSTGHCGFPPFPFFAFYCLSVLLSSSHLSETMSAEKEREGHVYMAKLAEQAERYDGNLFPPFSSRFLFWGFSF